MKLQKDLSGISVCKVCGTAIRCQAACKHCGEPASSFVENANYCEVSINLDDGSTHTTNMCKQCAGKLTLDEFAEVRAVDLAKIGMSTEHYTRLKVVGYTINTDLTG